MVFTVQAVYVKSQLAIVLALIVSMSLSGDLLGHTSSIVQARISP